MQLHKKTAVLGAGFETALLSAVEMGAVDAAAGLAFSEGTFDLMLNAAHAVMDVVLARFGSAARIAILCGPGNNGGDGYALAALLHARGLRPDVFNLGDPRRGSDAERARGMWRGAVEPLGAFQPRSHDLVVDALFGAGLARALEGEAERAAFATRDAGIPVLSVDLPSGLNGDTGETQGVGFRADVTVTFFRKKPGHLLFPGRGICGELIVSDIGIRPRATVGMVWKTFENGPCLWRHASPNPSWQTHKYARGAVGVVSGDATHTGAARLAALAAERAGAGAVTLLGPHDAMPVLAGHLTSAMISRCDDGADLRAFLASGKTSALVLGPAGGVGARLWDLFEASTEYGGAAASRLQGLVLDADMLTVMAENPQPAFARLAACPVPAVLTPHDGEFARLFGSLRGLPKLERARRAAEMSGAVVLLKGADTVVAAPDGRAAINTNGTPALATAGSGDVLAGVIAAHLAQGMPAWEAACAGAWLHGEAGRIAGEGAGAVGIAEMLRSVEKPSDMT
jgi:hydroxyethylthiazole kinase-like uncharacterized protein yjeF